MFQAYNLFPHMRVIDNVTLGAVRGQGTARETAREAGMALLARFGLEDRAREYPDRLSGGQQQRVAIVRAMLTHPRALLLDEVTSALDPELVGEVLEVIRELKVEGMTMILATHEMSFARDVADQVCFLEDGRIVEQGPPGQILSAPQRAETQRFLARLIDSLADCPARLRSRPRWTSPASSATDRPEPSSTISLPSSSMPAAIPLPPSQLIRLPAQRVTGTDRGQHLVGAAHRTSDSSATRRRASAGSISAGESPSVPARSRSSGGKLIGLQRDVDTDPKHRPALLGPSLDKDPRDLATIDQDVVGPLDQRLPPQTSATATPAASDSRLAGPGSARSRAVTYPAGPSRRGPDARGPRSAHRP